MTTVKTRTLGKVISVSKGKKHLVVDLPSKSSKRMLGIDDLRNDDLLRFTDDASGVFVVPNDLLIAWDGANAGTIGYGKTGYIGSTIARLRILKDEKIYTPFLGAFLKSKFEYLRQTATGATIPHISRRALDEIELPDVDYSDQVRAASLLGKVEKLISSRKHHLQQLNDLLMSVFLDTFGPQSAGYSEWPLVEIRDLAAKHKGAMRTGPFGSNLLHSEFTTEGDVAVIGIDNAVQNRFSWSERRYITHEKYRELESYRIFPGDVIITIMGTIGRSAVIPDDIPLSVNTKHLAAITLNKDIANPIFLSYSIHSSPLIKNQFRSKNRGAIMSGLNLGIIKETKLKRPPIELQNKFAEIHQKIDIVKSRYKYSLKEMETLYDALSQKVFKGELNLSRVPLQPTIPKGNESEIQESIHTNATETTINLPDTEYLEDAFQNPVALKALIIHWLEAYRCQMSDVPFSVQRFLTAAQTRLAARHPDIDFKLGAKEYEHIKVWVFEALASGSLLQIFDINDNQINIKVARA